MQLAQTRPLLIGERINASGSRLVKRLLLAEDYAGILQVAREQIEAGAQPCYLACPLRRLYNKSPGKHSATTSTSAPN